MQLYTMNPSIYEKRKKKGCNYFNQNKNSERAQWVEESYRGVLKTQSYSLEKKIRDTI